MGNEATGGGVQRYLIFDMILIEIEKLKKGMKDCKNENGYLTS
jgi:hypothetical protein